MTGLGYCAIANELGIGAGTTVRDDFIKITHRRETNPDLAYLLTSLEAAITTVPGSLEAA